MVVKELMAENDIVAVIGRMAEMVIIEVVVGVALAVVEVGAQK